MSEAVIDSFGALLTPLLVFSAGVAYVTIDTMRIMFVSKGLRHVAAILAAIAITTFLLAAGAVLSDPLEISNVVAYGIGYGVGTHLGITVENRLAVGNVLARVISEKDTSQLADILRGKEFEITTVSAESAAGRAHILFSVIKRKSMRDFLQLVHRVDSKAFVSFQDVRAVNGGNGVLHQPERVGPLHALSSRMFAPFNRHTPIAVDLGDSAKSGPIKQDPQITVGPS